MERLNSEGIRQKDLVVALKNRRMVADARRIDSCLLCRRPAVNEAGLCIVCYGMLEGEALDLALRWLQGGGP